MKTGIFTSSNRRWLVLLFVVMLLMQVLVTAPMVVRGQGQYVLLVALLVPIVVLILVKPHTGLVILILGAFSFDYLVGLGYLPSIGTWILDGLSGLLFIGAILDKRLSHRVLKLVEFRLLLVWLFLIIFAAVINSSSPLQVILGTHLYFRFALLYYCLLGLHFPDGYIERCTRLVIILYWLQLPATLFQRLSGLQTDSISGTLAASGGSGTIGLIGLGFFAGLSAFAVLTRRGWFFFVGLSVLVIPAFSAARAFIWAIPVVVVYVFWRLKLYRQGRQVFITAVSLGLLLFTWDKLQGVSTFRNSSAVEALSNLRVALDELWAGPIEGTQGGSIGRLAGLQLAWERVTQSASSFLFGYGPASAQGSRFGLVSSDLFESLSLAGGRASQLSRSLLEWGIFGTLVYVGMCMVVMLRSELAYREEKDAFWKSVAFGQVVFSVVMVAMMVYTSTWSATTPSFVFWFVGAAIFQHRHLVTTGEK